MTTKNEPKRPRGRPRKAPEEQRRHLLGARFDDGELAELERAKDAAGLFTVAEWAREVLLREARDPRPEA